MEMEKRSGQFSVALFICAGRPIRRAMTMEHGFCVLQPICSKSSEQTVFHGGKKQSDDWRRRRVEEKSGEQKAKPYDAVLE